MSQSIPARARHSRNHHAAKERRGLIQRRLVRFAILLASSSAAFAQASSAPHKPPKIERRPPPADYSRMYGKPTSLPAFDAGSKDPFQMDLRSTDLSGLDLRQSGKDLLLATFDTRTRWPATGRLPADFDVARIMELGKNPGLGLRSLHARGITGRGVAIAIVDQPLIVDHEEFGARIRLYEEINITPDTPAQMHGPAVASIAAGKTVGVAPEADIYFIAAFAFDTKVKVRPEQRDFRWYAQAIRRILEVNQQLPPGGRIRAISLSAGWNASEAGYDEMQQAVLAAKDAGLLITSSNFERIHGRQINGLGRAPLADPDRFDSYAPGMFWTRSPDNPVLPHDALLIPMDSRATAAPNGRQDYAFYRQGGWSWITPYLAGVYALAAQVKPEITPDEFLMLAFKTGRPLDWPTQTGRVALGVIIEPSALIQALQTAP